MTTETKVKTKKLSERQLQLLRSLPRFGKVRTGLGEVSRDITVRGKTYRPSTFNSLVCLGLVWGHETNTGHCVGRLDPSEQYL